MKVYDSEKIRNIAVVGHQGAGKTSLTECMIFDTGATTRLGKVGEGNTVADYIPEEIKRKITINASLVATEWHDHKLNLLDTPGFSEFLGDMTGAMSVCESLLMVLDAVSGVQVTTEMIWDIADEFKSPIIAVMNKLDRENADFHKAVGTMEDKLTRSVVPVQLPIGEAEKFHGVVDLLTMKAYELSSGKAVEIPIPAELRDDAENYRDALIEVAAEGDDDITMKYLDGEELTAEEIVFGLKEGIRNANVVPVLCTAATKNMGADLLMNFLIEYGPNPLQALPEDAAKAPLAALIFRTMADPFVGKLSFFKVFSGVMKPDFLAYNSSKDVDEKVAALCTMQGKTQLPLAQINTGDIGVVAKLPQAGTSDTLTTREAKLELPPIKFAKPTLMVAISPKSKNDEDKLGNAIARVLEEDPTLRYDKNKETHQTVLTGMGETHIGIVCERLQRKFGVEVSVEEMRLPYREAIRGKALHIEGKHKKQSGGHGQFGHVFIDVEPCPEADFIFEEKVFGGSVPKNYFPAVEKGVREAMVEGVLAGYPVSNIKVTLTDGSYHPVDSSEMAFKIATAQAFKKACEVAKPILLEPIVNVKIRVPDQYMGDIMGDMNTRRGRISGMEKEGKVQIIRAQVPMAEMGRYSIDLRSITQGRGRFSMEFCGYEEAPQVVADKVIAAAKAQKAAEEK